jgi:hypothetical protein
MKFRFLGIKKGKGSGSSVCVIPEAGYKMVRPNDTFDVTDPALAKQVAERLGDLVEVVKAPPPPAPKAKENKANKMAPESKANK